MYIVKKEEKDKKVRFSPFKLDVKDNQDISYPDIKKAGRSQTKQDDVKVVNNNCTGKDIKSNVKIKRKKKK